MYLASTGGYPPLRMALDQYEIGTTQVLESILQSGMVFIDAGAHVGYFSLIAARLVGPEGLVYSFEPDPSNHQLLEKNIELNNYKNVTPVNSALSDRPGTMTLHLTSLDTGRHSLYPQDIPLKGQINVPTTTLDAFLDARGWPQIDLIKMDVEGSEEDVINGMSELMKRNPKPQLLIEFNPALLRRAGVDLFKFIDSFQSWGMDVQWIDEEQGLISYDEDAQMALIDHLISHDLSMNILCSSA